jgi:hypothetical protein
VRRTRKGFYDNSQFASNKEEAPPNTPKWMRVGYNGSLKSLIEKQIEAQIDDNVEEEAGSDNVEEESDEEAGSDNEEET